MDPQQQSRRRPARGQVLWTVGIVIALLILIVTGVWFWGILTDYVHPKTATDRKDLVNVFAIIVAGAVGSLSALAAVGNFYISRRNLQQQQILESRRTQEQRILEWQRAQDNALQTYFDQLGQMLLDKHDPLRASESTEAVTQARILARVRTLVVLPRLDGDRKGTVVRFLYESDLISKDQVVIALQTADLSSVNLSRADLSEEEHEQDSLNKASLVGANLNEANLSNTWLEETDLSASKLRGANLREAKLRGANLSGADLSGANLCSADMEGVLLWGANLKNVDLTGANLTGANLNIRTAFPMVVLREYAGKPMEEFPKEVMRRAHAIAKLGREEVQNQELDYVAKSLKDATMPTGQRYEDWVNTKNEDWLDPEKSRKDDGENSGS